MLSKIFIQNFALIDSLEVKLHPGLQVITGETGAGKSIILGALRLILGERADIKNISDTSTKSIVEAEFIIKNHLKTFFEENDLDFEENTIIRREILPSGKSRAFVNDVPVTLDILKQLSEQLIDIHSQFETSNLFSEEYQFKIIDGLSENKKEIDTYQNHFLEYQNIKKEIEKLKNLHHEGNKESDYKNFLREELEEQNLEQINFEDLQNLASTQENAGMISENLSFIINRFQQEELGILPSISELKNKLEKISDVSPQFEEISNRLQQSFIELKDIESELEREAEKIEINPELLAELLAKINKINSLFLKHNVNSVEELIVIKNKLTEESSGFENLESLIAEKEHLLLEKQSLLEKSSASLSKNRKKSAPVFKQKTEELLQKLGLEKARIEVELSSTKDFVLYGKDKISLLFQANSGFPLKPIQNAISGGERSRVMLAIKKLMAENVELPTLILDEIDTGVSGKIANEMGNLMKEMAENRQLIVITHLAQVAAKGNHNFKVVKSEVSGKTQTQILPLSSEEKLNEIAQLLSGSKITDAAILQAKELMQ